MLLFSRPLGQSRLKRVRHHFGGSGAARSLNSIVRPAIAIWSAVPRKTSAGGVLRTNAFMTCTVPCISRSKPFMCSEVVAEDK